MGGGAETGAGRVRSDSLFNRSQEIKYIDGQIEKIVQLHKKGNTAQAVYIAKSTLIEYDAYLRWRPDVNYDDCANYFKCYKDKLVRLLEIKKRIPIVFPLLGAATGALAGFGISYMLSRATADAITGRIILGSTVVGAAAGWGIGILLTPSTAHAGTMDAKFARENASKFAHMMKNSPGPMNNFTVPKGITYKASKSQKVGAPSAPDASKGCSGSQD